MRSSNQVRIFSSIAISLLAASSTFARTWTSSDGKSSFEGELILYDAATGQVTMDREGQKVSIQKELLSTADITLLNTQAKPAPESTAPIPGNWKRIPELSDEFEGEKLDSTKWHDHDPSWKGREPGFFSPKNVTLGEGKLHLTARVETLENLPNGYHTFTTAAVKSKAEVKYGYFEIRCKPMKSKASSAFWFYRSTAEEWTEIDVFEICGEGDKWKNIYNMNAHVFRTPTEQKHFQKPGRWKAPFNFADDFHTYGLEWNKETIKWWVDGRMVHEMKNTHWHQSLRMLFDSETFPDCLASRTRQRCPRHSASITSDP